jgi:hypothetical protein
MDLDKLNFTMGALLQSRGECRVCSQGLGFRVQGSGLIHPQVMSSWLHVWGLLHKMLLVLLHGTTSCCTPYTEPLPKSCTAAALINPGCSTG